MSTMPDFENMSYHDFLEFLKRPILPYSIYDITKEKHESKLEEVLPFTTKDIKNPADDLTPPKLYRMVTGLYFSYIDWAYNNRNLLYEISEPELFKMSNYSGESYAWVDDMLENKYGNNIQFQNNHSQDSADIYSSAATALLWDALDEMYWEEHLNQEQPTPTLDTQTFGGDIQEFNLLDQWINYIV